MQHVRRRDSRCIIIVFEGHRFISSQLIWCKTTLSALTDTDRYRGFSCVADSTSEANACLVQGLVAGRGTYLLRIAGVVYLIDMAQFLDEY